MNYIQNNFTQQDNKNCVNSNKPSNYYIDAINNKCSCPNCDCKGTILLKIICQPTTGYYCDTCAVDLKFHGIAEEVASELIVTDTTLYDESVDKF